MNKFIVSVVGAAVLGVLAACGGVSEVTKERVARSETSVQQAQQTVGNSEAGAVELQQAKSKLEAAQNELGKKNGVEADRFAAEPGAAGCGLAAHPVSRRGTAHVWHASGSKRREPERHSGHHGSR